MAAGDKLTPGTFFGTEPQKLSADQFLSGGGLRLVEPETEEEKLGFVQRFGEDLQKRKQIAQEVIQASQEGEQSWGEGVLQLVGKVGAGAVLDFIGEGLVSAGRLASAVTPDIIEDPIRESAKVSAERLFLNSSVGQLGMKALESGAPAYEEFKQENPRAARNIESVVDIALVLTPASRSAAPRQAVRPTGLGRTAESLRGSAGAQDVASRAGFVDDLISPKRTARVRLEETGRTAEEGVLRSKVVELTPAQQRISAEINTIPGVTPGKTLQGNMNAIDEALSVEASSLLETLEASRVLIPRVETRRALEAAGRSLESIPTLTGDAAKTAERLVDNAMKFVAENPGTSAGLLKARQEFDRFLLSQKRNALGDAPIENALTIAAKEIRQTMNQIIASKNPSVGVRTSLDKQSTMFRALENIGPKAADEGKNVIMRAWQNSMKVLPVRGEFNQLMATAFGIGGLGASAQFAPVFTGAVITGGLAYAGGRALLSAPAKRALSQLITVTDDAIKAATNPEMISQLRADRALLVEIVQEEN